MRTRSLNLALKGFPDTALIRSTRIDARSVQRSSWICQRCRALSTQYTAGPGTESRFISQLVSESKRYNSSRRFTTSQHSYSSETPESKAIVHELPSKQEIRRTATSKQLSHMMDNIQTNLFTASQRLNDLTGYSAIEALKKEIQTQEDLVQSSRIQLLDAKEAYSQAINQRSQSQREVNELLQRKHAWSPQDLERFTSLYRSDHANEQAESEAQAAVTQAEHVSEEVAAKLNARILARYHEEQIWSDKIRRMSTWGTWGLMGVNVLLFLIFQIGVEPWRRKRLVKGFEEKVVEALEKETAIQKRIAGISAVAVDSATQTELDSSGKEISFSATAAPEQAEVSVQEPTGKGADSFTSESILLKDITARNATSTSLSEVFSQDAWKDIFQTIRSQLVFFFGTQLVEVRQVDVTTKFIEGAISSAVAISLLAAIFRTR